jgi:hypothetical protein
MYDMYPDWGPAHHWSPQPWDDHDDGFDRQPVQSGLDRRDNGGEGPDDN